MNFLIFICLLLSQNGDFGVFVIEKKLLNDKDWGFFPHLLVIFVIFVLFFSGEMEFLDFIIGNPKKGFFVIFNLEVFVGVVCGKILNSVIDCFVTFSFNSIGCF